MYVKDLALHHGTAHVVRESCRICLTATTRPQAQAREYLCVPEHADFAACTKFQADLSTPRSAEAEARLCQAASPRPRRGIYLLSVNLGNPFLLGPLMLFLGPFFCLLLPGPVLGSASCFLLLCASRFLLCLSTLLAFCFLHFFFGFCFFALLMFCFLALLEFCLFLLFPFCFLP